MTEFTLHDRNSELWGKFADYCGEQILTLHKDLEKTSLTDLETAALRGRIRQLRLLLKLLAADASATAIE